MFIPSGRRYRRSLGASKNYCSALYVALFNWRTKLHHTQKACLSRPLSAHGRLVVCSLCHVLQQHLRESLNLSRSIILTFEPLFRSRSAFVDKTTPMPLRHFVFLLLCLPVFSQNTFIKPIVFVSLFLFHLTLSFFLFSNSIDTKERGNL